PHAAWASHNCRQASNGESARVRGASRTARSMTRSISATSSPSGRCGSLVNHFGGRLSADTPVAGRPSTSTRSRTKACGASVMVAMPYLNGMRVRTSVRWMSPSRMWILMAVAPPQSLCSTPPPNPLPATERGRKTVLLPLSVSGRGLGGGVSLLCLGQAFSAHLRDPRQYGGDVVRHFSVAHAHHPNVPRRKHPVARGIVRGLTLVDWAIHLDD